MRHRAEKAREQRLPFPQRWPLLAGVVGVALLVIALVGWSTRDRPTGLPKTIAANTAAALASQTSSPATTPPVPAASPPAEPNSPPTTLQISSLKINAPVVSVGVDAAGDMQIPDDVHTLGWYQFGPAPGSSTGSVVVVGHVDSAEQGIGIFSTLKSITAGAPIVLSTADGQQRQYKVVGVQAYPKSAVPLSDLFSTTGAPRLTLITCGGLFDKVTHSYESNVVVTASPS
ncbi:MAG: class F sortase [Antricoccus sp.]